jgi:hypothetical protein
MSAPGLNRKLSARQRHVWNALLDRHSAAGFGPALDGSLYAVLPQAKASGDQLKTLFVTVYGCSPTPVGRLRQRL